MTDQFLYLEALEGQDALSWVNQENHLTTEKFTKNQFFEQTYQELESVLFDAEALPYVSKKDGYVYNFWQDEKNVIGIWRRTTLEKYQAETIEWELIIDFDELSKKENIQWFYGGVDVFEHDDQYCLVYLAENGSDSVQIREFNLEHKTFVEDGFFIDTAKTHTQWINKDEIYVMSDFGEESLTLSGYPRLVKRWKRGTTIDQAQTVFQVDIADMIAGVGVDHTVGHEKHVFNRVKNFYENEYFIGEEQQKIDIPLDANFSFYRNLMLLELKSAWDISAEYTAGSLLMIDFNAFMKGDRNFTLIVQSTKDKILSGYTYTQDFLILNMMKDVSNYLEIYDIRAGLKRVDSIYADEAYSQISIDSVEKNNNDMLVTIESFITPPTQYLIDINTMQKTQLKSRKHSIDSDDYCVEQHFVYSKDGTKVPYFQISKKNNSTLHPPVLIEGYGGFEVSLLPRFLETEIVSWISKGGVYVVANIRGGSEYGPTWHQQALKQHRHRAYEDFAAVAQDFIQRNITVKEKLAAIGGSNGGLLMGNMLMQYPDLFAAIVCEVPLLDMLRYNQIGAGYSWIAEYGDPENREDAEFLKTISPYHLLDHQPSQSKLYPAVLFYTSTSDDRVTPVHARKMAAKMKAMNMDHVYFYEQQEGGHSIFANKKLTAFHSALVSSFLLDTMYKG